MYDSSYLKLILYASYHNNMYFVTCITYVRKIQNVFLLYIIIILLNSVYIYKNDIKLL